MDPTKNQIHPEILRLAKVSSRAAQRLLMGEAAVLPLTAAAAILPIADQECREWLYGQGLVYDLNGRSVVVWADVMDAVRQKRAQPAAPKPAPKPAPVKAPPPPKSTAQQAYDLAVGDRDWDRVGATLGIRDPCSFAAAWAEMNGLEWPPPLTP